MDIKQILQDAVAAAASDVHITVGLPPMIRVNGELRRHSEGVLSPEDCADLAAQILTDEQQAAFRQHNELDVSYTLRHLARFRVNAYRQRNSAALAIRIVNIEVPTIDSLGFPDILKELSLKQRGLILVTGPTGSGKSTTLAAMINHINENRSCHVLTLEDPIEYLHRHKAAMINQREIGNDSESFATGLRAALREDPDVILVGEMRDIQTIATAVTAAETGHLVLSTLHTSGAEQTIDRIIDAFPPYQQQQIRIQLASVLVGIISQQLLLMSNRSGRVAALEILMASNAARNLIRESKTHQIPTVIQTGGKLGMKTMDRALAELFHKGQITRETALTHCIEETMLNQYLFA